MLSGSLNVLFGIDILRKICNHPLLLKDNDRWEACSSVHDEAMGVKNGRDWLISGKMIVVRELLCQWKAGRDKVLIFCQTQQMLNLIEDMIRKTST